MLDSLAALEDGRSRLLLEFAQLGEFRRGSIQSLFRRCGKPNCACAQAGQPGHGPVKRPFYSSRRVPLRPPNGLLQGPVTQLRRFRCVARTCARAFAEALRRVRWNAWASLLASQPVRFSFLKIL